MNVLHRSTNKLAEPEWETLNIREMEILAESEDREQQQNPQ